MLVRLSPALAFLALACEVDNTLTGKDEGDVTFDTSSDWQPPDTDTADTGPVEEVCNGEDDNGDGVVDEGFPDANGNGRADCLDEECPALDLGVTGSIAIPEECSGTSGSTTEVTDDPWNAVVKWSYGSGKNAWMTPVIGNLDDDNGDGVVDEDDSPEVVVSMSDSTIVCLEGATGAVKWTFTGANGYSGTSIADVDADGWPDVIAANSSKRTIVIDGEGNLKWTAAEMLASISYVLHNVADLDEDGLPEVIYDSQVMNGEDGTTDFEMTVGSSGGSWSYRLPAIGDVDLDGDQEIALEGALYDSDGTLLWDSGEVGTYGFWPFMIQADSDPEAEIGFVGQKYTLWDHDGSMIYSKVYNTTAQPGPPCAGDFDGDGTAEVAWPAYQNFVAYELDGSQMWSVPMDDTSGLAGCSAYDLNNDGALEILFADQSSFTVFDGATGTELFVDSTHRSPTIFEYPTVADMDADGHAEIVVAHYGGSSALTVYEHGGSGWPAAGSTWNVHDFAITNINPDGSVPQNPEPSWQKYNVYRARVAVDDPSQPDLLPNITDVCMQDCDYGPIRVAVQVINQGGAESKGTEELVLYSDDWSGPREVARMTMGVIPAGTRELAVEFELTPADVGDYGWIAVIDEGEALNECSETNNTALWTDTSCL